MHEPYRNFVRWLMSERRYIPEKRLLFSLGETVKALREREQVAEQELAALRTYRLALERYIAAEARERPDLLATIVSQHEVRQQ